MNLVNPWFGGVPTCHGSGGMAGHFAFGGRTGGSVVIYGALFVSLGLFFGGGFDQIAKAFPLPMLGVILLFEALALIWLLRDTAHSRTELPITALVGIVAVGLPHGYMIGLIVGTILFYLSGRTRLISPDAEQAPLVTGSPRRPDAEPAPDGIALRRDAPATTGQPQ
jgi:MFS superfamily sulfate permease-like transporter